MESRRIDALLLCLEYADGGTLSDRIDGAKEAGRLARSFPLILVMGIGDPYEQRPRPVPHAASDRRACRGPEDLSPEELEKLVVVSMEQSLHRLGDELLLSCETLGPQQLPREMLT